VSMWAVLRAVVPFYIPLFLMLFVITIWPDLVLWLPKMLR